ncbi:serine/threonine-protein kinase [Nocardiopsis sp. HUAS JQ3]|uniref:serine/threonine-protein kinase n=1 Tax=Nocardiopsis sp. HUAS JQ3 TaxID=3061629 RepID=UPI0023A9E803|nr:serine/threonine protein kinase [Nocardiopsis sp. HUAS JQ3]WDZ89563.1 protein kinase [Nocardiopsis sp. HUAS JQ3]
MTSNGQQSGKPLRVGDPRELDGYRIVSRLGRGGMGTVYLARDASDRSVAVKLIHPDLADDESFRLRFAREVEAARRVARFSTAGVIDARLEGDPLFIVSEYVPGPNLDEAVRADGSMAGGTLEGLAMGVAAALTAIHGSGVVHRDLKPANVLLSTVGPKVIDFGIARALDEAADAVTRSSQLMGTPSYMAPELILGERATAAADIFAWGCLVAFAGTGTAPFDAATVPAVLHNISSAPPRLDGLDPDMYDLVNAALDKDPANRPTSKQLLARLTGQEDPQESEVERTISTSWAPPSSSPVPGRPPRDTGVGVRESGPAAHQAPSGPQQAEGQPPDSGPQQGAALPDGGQPLQAQATQYNPYAQPTHVQHPVQPPHLEQRHGNPGLQPPGPQQGAGYGGHPPQGQPQVHGQQVPGHYAHSGGQVPPAHQAHGGHPSPAQGQHAFNAYSGPGGPGAPGPPGSPAGPSGGAPRKRRRLVVIGAAAGAVVLVAAVGAAVLLNDGPGIPENTVSIHNPDFSSDPGWVSNTYAYEESDGYWAEQEGVVLTVEPDTQPSRGEVVELEQEQELPADVLVSSGVYAVTGPEQSMFGLRCWDNDGEDGRSQYEALLRHDGQGASVRRMSETEGDSVLAEATDVPGYVPYPVYDESSREEYGIDAGNPFGFDHENIPTNTVTLSCRFDEAEDTMELSMWVNEEHVLTTVDDNPLPQDAEEPQDRRRVGIVARQGPSNQPFSAFFTDFSLHRILEEGRSE